jgi:hypothetical protein
VGSKCSRLCESRGKRSYVASRRAATW